MFGRDGVERFGLVFGDDVLAGGKGFVLIFIVE